MFDESTEDGGVCEKMQQQQQQSGQEEDSPQCSYMDNLLAKAWNKIEAEQSSEANPEDIENMKKTASDLEYACLNDKKICGHLIFYEFRSGKPIFECYKSFCSKMGPNSIDYRDFEFWWMRFSAGNFDLDYDRSQDPVGKTIYDVPMEVIRKICVNLGDNYQKEYRFVLRNVCKSFRSLADSWIPEFKTITLRSLRSGGIIIYFDGRAIEYKGRFVPMNDLMSILPDPQLKLEEFDVSDDKLFQEELLLKLETLKKTVYVKSVNLYYNRRYQAILHVLEGEEAYFNGLIDGLWEFIEKISERKENGITETRFPRIDAGFAHMTIKEVEKLLKKFLEFSNLKRFQIRTRLRATKQIKNSIVRCGAKIQPDRPDILHYPIPNSDEFFEIEITLDIIRIERI